MPSYMYQISHSWHIASTFEIIILLALIVGCIVMDFLINHLKSHKKNYSYAGKLNTIFSILLLCGIIWLPFSFIHNPNSNSFNNVKHFVPTSSSTTKRINYLKQHNYSSFSIPHTYRMVKQDQSVLPHMWKHDEYLKHHITKEPTYDHTYRFTNSEMENHYYHKYQSHVISVQSFVNANKKYVTNHFFKQHFSKPSWYHYL